MKNKLTIAVLLAAVYLFWLSLAFRRGFPAGISRLTTPPACAARPGCTV